MTNYKSTAQEYHSAGLKVIPFWHRPDGGKTFPADYHRYRDGQTADDINTLFSRDSDGIAVLCTDGMEAIDIDVKHDPAKMIDRLYLDATMSINKDLVLRCCFQQTKSGGYHIIYRCPEPGSNVKLATLEGIKEAVIETRGQGGLLFVAPTPGYFFELGDLKALPTITQEERDFLINAARSFNHEIKPIDFRTQDKTQAFTLAKEKPWEAFDAVTDVLGMVEQYGWTIVNQQGDYIRLNRPGSAHSKGVDASVIVSKNCFYPFTTSSEFTAHKGYSPSSVYAVMEHGGDFSAAAKDLYRKGFGDRVKAVDEQAEQAKDEKVVNTLMGRVLGTEYKYGDIEKVHAWLSWTDGKKTYPVAGPGQIGVFVGHEKSGKSFTLSCIAASALSGGAQKLGFSFDLQGRKLAWFDTEQSEYFYRVTQKRIHDMAGIRKNVSWYKAYHMRPLTPDQRLTVIEEYVYTAQDLGCIIIDGFVDLTNDYNDLREAQARNNLLLKWADEKDILIMGVLHLNKGDGKIRGHFGSEIKNKAETIIKTSKADGGIYCVSNPAGRYMEFPAFEFTRDENGMPVGDMESMFEPTPF